MRCVRPRGRAQTGWVNNVMIVLNARGMCVEQGRAIVCDRNKWRAVVNA